MRFTIGLAQCRHRQGEDAIALVARFADEAQKADVDLLVFSESLMSFPGETTPEFIAAAQSVDGPFTHAVDAIAAACGMWVVYTVNEANPGGKPFNTAVVVDNKGVRQGAYRKTHLFDAGDKRESDRMTAGDKLFEPVDTPFGKLGLGICYDLRFPEVARHAALAGCDVMLYPAAWVAGPHKVEQWKTLLAARAIENEMFAVGACCVDQDRIGRSCVFDPMGVELASGGTGEELVTCQLDGGALDAVRQNMPVFEHRRADLYR